MKRDWDVIREILFKIEESNAVLSLSDFDRTRADEINYHVQLLEEAGFIDASIAKFSDGITFSIERLTWNGHDFIASIRDETIWNKTKALITEKSGMMTFELIKSVAIGLAASRLGISI